MPEVRRQLTIDADPAAVWDALTTEDGLASWLADGVEGEIAAGGRAIFRYASGERREAQIDEVRAGERVAWRWSRDGFEESRVVVAVAREGDGSRVTVTETAPSFAALAMPLGGATGAAPARDAQGRFTPALTAALPEWARALRRLAQLPLGRVALCA